MFPGHPSSSLRGHAQFLTVVNAFLEVSRILGVSKVYSKESKRTCMLSDFRVSKSPGRYMSEAGKWLGTEKVLEGNCLK